MSDVVLENADPDAVAAALAEARTILQALVAVGSPAAVGMSVVTFTLQEVGNGEARLLGIDHWNTLYDKLGTGVTDIIAIADALAKQANRAQPVWRQLAATLRARERARGR